MIISLRKGVHENRVVRRIFVPMGGNVTRVGMVRYVENFNKSRNKYSDKILKKHTESRATKLYSNLTTKQHD
jgi:hypothetical protein